MTNIKDLTIADRLDRLGYTYQRDDFTSTDGRMAIYARGQEGYAIDRLNASEAADFCAKYE